MLFRSDYQEYSTMIRWIQNSQCAFVLYPWITALSEDVQAQVIYSIAGISLLAFLFMLFSIAKGTRSTIIIFINFCFTISISSLLYIPMLGKTFLILGLLTLGFRCEYENGAYKSFIYKHDKCFTGNHIGLTLCSILGALSTIIISGFHNIIPRGIFLNFRNPLSTNTNTERITIYVLQTLL